MTPHVSRCRCGGKFLTRQSKIKSKIKNKNKWRNKMADVKEVNGKLSIAGKLTIKADLANGDYALRVFQDKSTSEIIYRSTRIKTLEQTENGFECDAYEGCANKFFEIKNIKTGQIVVTGLIELDVPAAAVEDKNPEDKE
jgi:hypothetical protein